MSSISSIGCSILASLYSSNSLKSSKTGGSSAAVEKLFAQLDTTGKGYLEKGDLSSAFSQISGTTSSTSSSSTASVDDVFDKFDSNSDGKVTEDELSTGLDALAAELDSQFGQMRMSGGTPPPPPGSDTSFSKDELTQQLGDITRSSSDSARSDLLTKVVANFDAADSNADGKVSFQEAQAYDQSTSSTSSSASTTSSSANDGTTGSDLAIMKRIMELMNAYAPTGSTDSNSAAGTLSVSA